MKETLLLTKHMRENPENSHLIEVYEKNNGYSAARKVFKENNPGDVIEEIKTSNIRGRGGAGFHTGVKWGFLAEDEERYLVINADESEPGTFKDRILLERDPHQLIEGIIVTSFASNISKAFIYIRGEYAKPARRVQDAVEQAYEKGYLGKNIFDWERLRCCGAPWCWRVYLWRGNSFIKFTRRQERRAKIKASLLSSSKRAIQ